MTPEREISPDEIGGVTESSESGLFGRDPFVVVEKFMGPLDGVSDQFKFACSREVHPIRAILTGEAEQQSVIQEAKEDEIMLRGCKKDSNGRDILQ